VENVTARTSAQVAQLRDELHTLREQRPKLREMAYGLKAQMDQVAASYQDQRIDYDTVQTVQGALGDVAKGLDGVSDTLDVDRARKVGDGLGETADFLDQQLAPAADKTADQIDESTAA